jgi:hypothetical protein
VPKLLIKPEAPQYPIIHVRSDAATKPQIPETASTLITCFYSVPPRIAARPCHHYRSSAGNPWHHRVATASLIDGRRRGSKPEEHVAARIMHFVRNLPADDCEADRVFSSRHAEIAAVAYSLAQARGFTPGHEVEDWLAAEREVDARWKRAAH